MQRTTPTTWKIVLALATVYVVWGSTYLAIKWALVDFPPFFMGGVRFVIAGTILLTALRFAGHAWPSSRQWYNVAIVGTLLLAGGNGLVCYAEQTVSSGLAAVAVACMPLFAAVFAGLFGQWPSRRDALGLAVGFIGVILLNLGAEMRASPTGALALLAAPAAWAFGSVWSRGRDMPAPWMNTAAQMLVGGLMLCLISVLRGEAPPHAPSAQALGALAYLIVFGSFLGFGAYVYLLHHVRPALATSYAYVNPPIAVLFGVLFAGETTHAQDLLAMAVIIIGVAIILTAPRR